MLMDRSGIEDCHRETISYLHTLSIDEDIWINSLNEASKNVLKAGPMWPCLFLSGLAFLLIRDAAAS